jgi:DNA modification methylase
MFKEAPIKKETIHAGLLHNSAIELAPLSDELRAISILNDLAEERWTNRLVVEPILSRSVVSFQANKARAVYRWYKYKEAFSAGLVEYFLDRYQISSGTLFDPFAGSGTALFTAGSFGLRAEGIELLPIGQKIIETKQVIDWDFTSPDIDRLEFWSREKPWKTSTNQTAIPELRITKGAYSQVTLAGMGKFLSVASSENERVKQVLMFALLCILESISFTRKDGQYLRWDYRSGRRQPSKIFDKGRILEFDEAISDKIDQIIIDLQTDSTPGDLFAVPRTKTEIQLHSGSCLSILPTLSSEYVDCVITSPPYCNRYDYTRTYALELALLGSGEEDVLRLRQEMLSCTVENRAKNLLSINPSWQHAISCADNHDLLQLILSYLEKQNELDLLNNTGIPRMVRGYFYEMTCVISELSRLCKPGARVIMVNDNVRYAGASISVDIILSELAEQLGFVAEQILVSPNGKGNSSQQMGLHGRDKLRKCVYVWRKK